MLSFLSPFGCDVLFASQVVDRWLSVRLELLGNCVVLTASLLSVVAASNGRLIAGLAGLSITNALRYDRISFLSPFLSPYLSYFLSISPPFSLRSPLSFLPTLGHILALSVCFSFCAASSLCAAFYAPPPPPLSAIVFSVFTRLCPCLFLPIPAMVGVSRARSPSLDYRLTSRCGVEIDMSCGQEKCSCVDPPGCARHE